MRGLGFEPKDLYGLDPQSSAVDQAWLPSQSDGDLKGNHFIGYHRITKVATLAFESDVNP